MPEPSSASPHYHIQAEFERDGKPVTGHFVGKFLNSKYEWAPFVLGSETDLELQRASKSKERYFEQLFDKVRLFWLHRSDGKKSKHFLKPGEVDRSSGFPWQLQRKYGTLVNHLQGEWMLARKDLLAALLYKAYGKEAWHLHPQTCTLHASADKSFEIADDVLSMLSPSSQAGCADGSAGDTDLAGTDLFILKPSGGSCGVGIRVARLSTASQLIALLSEHYSDFATVVFQRYVDKPLLFEGHKFDIRVNMLVLSVEPLVVYSHRGHIRLCGLPYDLENVEDLSRHLTNTHIQRFVPDMPHDEENDAVNGFKIRRDWASFGSMLEQNGMHLNDAEAAMNENMAKVMEAAAPALRAEGSDGQFALLGADFVLRPDGSVLLLELTKGPGLKTHIDHLREVHMPLFEDLTDLLIQWEDMRRRTPESAARLQNLPVASSFVQILPRRS